MFNFTPPIRQNVVFNLSLFLVCTLLSACTRCAKPNSSRLAPPDEDTAAVTVSKSLYHNPDSLRFYAEQAYLHEDPEGLYVTGAAAYLRASDPDYPDSCTTVSLNEASIMLLRAAELGHPDALKLIRCLGL